MLLFEYCILSI